MKSLLFTPGSHPHRFPNALNAGADAVCLDLEDAVAPAEKDMARAAVARFLEASRPAAPCVGVRMNGLDSGWWQADLAAVGAIADFILIPKVASSATIDTVAREIGAQTALWPMVESAEGLREAWSIASAAGVRGLVFGAFDYVADVGCDMAWEPLLFARSRLVAAAARARIDLVDAPNGELEDLEEIQHSARRARSLGFTGQACIHPKQVGIINDAFCPSDLEVARARQILEAFAEAGDGATQLDGRLIDLPVAAAARRTLARAIP
jgi:citrate lyase beta subunit